MKRLVKTSALVLLLSLGAAAVQAQIVVRVRPARPAVVVKRPAAPGPAYVWVDDDWVLSGNAYTWKGGYWAAPPRHGAVYIKGHWRKRGHGWVWVPGRWK